MTISDNFNKFLERNSLKKQDAIFESASRTSSVNSSDLDSEGFKGVRLYLDITAVSGTAPTLNLKVQVYDEGSNSYIDLPNASFAEKSSTGTDMLTIYPGIAETANQAVSTVIGPQYRVVATIGGASPDFTFSLGADYLI